MTAIVGILNKLAAVLAADSAMTVTRGERMKVYNNTTKIFNLSQDNHVGVMFFNYVDFMGTPWEVIFKLYHDKRGGKQFATVKEYADDFYRFVASEKYFCGEEQQKDYFDGELGTYYGKVKSAAIEDFQKEIAESEDDEEVDKVALLRKHLLVWIEAVNEQAEELGVNPEFEDFSKKEFMSYDKELFTDLQELIHDDGLPVDMMDEWQHGFYNYIRSRLYYNGTGIIFVGYGSDDIFPTLLPTYVSGAFDNRLRYYIDMEGLTSIGDDCSAYICPFAQSDVMITLMKGIAPNYYEKVLESYTDSVTAIKEKIVNKLKGNGVDNALIEKVKALDTSDIDRKHTEMLDSYMQSEYIDGIVDAVESFSITDMVIMAENLVSITGLQRHFSSSDETVGGPIDVAVITRSEGFRWAKHKEEIPNI